tara:strand:- start:107 stop:244 length:138 start_codon:yes stop_codon:yes gene_type:complete
MSTGGHELFTMDHPCWIFSVGFSWDYHPKIDFSVKKKTTDVEQYI